MSKCWIYHETKEPQIVDASEAKDYYKKGWADSPAQWLDLSEQIDMTNEIEVQMVGEVLNETKERANDLLAADTARSKGLSALALKYEVKTKGLSTKDLRTSVIEAINGDSA